MDVIRINAKTKKIAKNTGLTRCFMNGEQRRQIIIEKLKTDRATWERAERELAQQSKAISQMINQQTKKTQENGEKITTVTKYLVNTVSYLTPDGKIVTIVVNEGVERELKLKVDRDNMTVYTTTQEKQMEETYKGAKTEITLPEKSITTIIFE